LFGRLEFEPLMRNNMQVKSLYGMPVLCVKTNPAGWLGEYRLRRAGRALERKRVLRTLAPPAFERWDVLRPYGLVPIDPLPLLRARSAPLAMELLERRGIALDRATVALRSRQIDSEMALAAAALCPQVRRLIISAPRGGDRLAQWLRWEFGVPILPPGEEGHVALCFQPCESVGERAVLRLHGPKPELSGLRLCAPELAEEDRENIFLLSALWEGGYMEENALKIT